jgi:hypothetical protein
VIAATLRHPGRLLTGEHYLRLAIIDSLPRERLIEYIVSQSRAKQKPAQRRIFRVRQN